MPYKDKEKQKQAKHESYLRNKKKVIESQQKRREKTRSYIQRKKVKSGCIECGESHVAALVFHHRDPNDKEVAARDMVRDRWLIERIDKELEKCDVLCQNCHHKLHWRWNHPDDPEGEKLAVVQLVRTSP